MKRSAEEMRLSLEITKITSALHPNIKRKLLEQQAAFHRDQTHRLGELKQIRDGHLSVNETCTLEDIVAEIDNDWRSTTCQQVLVYPSDVDLTLMTAKLIDYKTAWEKLLQHMTLHHGQSSSIFYSANSIGPDQPSLTKPRKNNSFAFQPPTLSTKQSLSRTGYAGCMLNSLSRKEKLLMLQQQKILYLEKQIKATLEEAEKTRKKLLSVQGAAGKGTSNKKSGPSDHTQAQASNGDYGGKPKRSRND